MNTVATIQAIINTLNRVTVSGAENMNRLLGSIQTLSNLQTALAEQEAKAKK